MATKPEKDLSQATVYSAIELSKKTWVVGISTPERDRPGIHRVAGGNFMELVARLRTAARDDRRLIVCYEAGYDGFWLARKLRSWYRMSRARSRQHPGQSSFPARQN